MSGISLLFDAAIEYERTHQLVLFTLLKKSDLGKFLLDIPQVQEVIWEPERQLFDLQVKGKYDQCFLEVKMWSALGADQLKRQGQFVERNLAAAGYVLLGSSWFEYPEEYLCSDLNLAVGRVKRLGYEELLRGLNAILVTPHQPHDVAELVLAYKKALEEQYKNLLNPAVWKNTLNQRLFYYSLYRLVQEQLRGIRTRIWFANNPAGGVALLNDIDWHHLVMSGVEVKLYHELVNGKLCIKFYAETKEAELKCKIRDRVRAALHGELGNQYVLRDIGRVGEYMTACQVEHEHLDITNIERVAEVFTAVHQAMPRIRELVVDDSEVSSLGVGNRIKAA